MAELAFQGSLFSDSGGSESFDGSFGGMHRIELSEDAWIDRQPDWAVHRGSSCRFEHSCRVEHPLS